MLNHLKAYGFILLMGMLMVALVACGTAQELDESAAEDSSAEGESLTEMPEGTEHDGEPGENESAGSQKLASGAPKDSDSVQAENEAFRVTRPAAQESLGMSFEVTGEAHADHIDGTVYFQLEDGHFDLASGSVTLEDGEGDWQPMHFTVDLDTPPSQQSGTLILYSGKDEDGSTTHTLYVPVKFADEAVEYLADGNRG